MAAKKKSDTESVVDKASQDVLNLLQPLADGLKVAVGELWSIFVRQQVVKGLNAVFTAGVLFASAYFLGQHIGYWALLPAAVGVVLIYDAIQHLGNPKYFALDDINKKMSKIRNER